MTTTVIPCFLPVGAEIHVTHSHGAVILAVTFPNRPDNITRPTITVEDDGRFHLSNVTLSTDGAVNLAIALTTGGDHKVAL